MIKRENAEIIAVGTELLLGQITNTNAAWISEQLADRGLNVYYHSVVGDNLQRVRDLFAQAQDRTDLIIVTGGLGPTDDDLTRDAFAAMSGLKLVEDKHSLEKLYDFFKAQKSPMTDNNKKQAIVFETANVLANSEGTAPGMIAELDGTTWVFLPGVPREMKSLCNEHVFPYLEETGGQAAVIKSLVLRFTGIGESKLEDELQDLIRKQTNPTIAPLVAKDGVTIRLTAKAETAETADLLNAAAKKAILDRVGEYCYGLNEESLAGSVYALLKEQKCTIAGAESLTGGMFTDELISIPGASAVCYGGIVSYDRSAKEKLLGISSELIDAYGTVSEQCAKAMANNVRQLLDTDIGIAFTGVAGPDETEGKSAGRVFIAIAYKDNVFAEQFDFQGGRQSVRSKSVSKGLEMIHKVLRLHDR